MKKKILYALLSFAIAFGLWTYVITVVSPEWEETYYNIPVVLNNETVLHENGLMVMEDETPKVTLKLLGNRSDLAYLNSANITLIADLAKIYETGEQQLSYSITYPGNVPDNSIEILSKLPQFITLTIAERKTVEVPVVPQYVGTVPEGYQTDKENMVLDHQFITVTGPASVVDQIKIAKILVDLEGKTEPINQKYAYTLCNKDGEPVVSERIMTDVSEVNLSLKIRRYKEIQLVVNVVYGGGATETNTVIQQDLKTIQVSGTQQQLDDLGDSLSLGEIRLGEIPENTTKEFEIKLPEGVENLTGKDTVSVKIEFSNLVSKSIKVSNIQAKNVPPGMKANIVTMEMAVVVRGPKAQIDALTAENLRVQVDFADAQAGADTYKALVQVNSGTFKGVGAVGIYSVYAEVTAIGNPS